MKGMGGPKAHHNVHKMAPLVRTQRKTDEVHTTTLYFSKIHINIIFPPETSQSYIKREKCLFHH